MILARGPPDPETASAWAPEKSSTEILRRLENPILRLVFANTGFHKRPMLLIISAEYTHNLLDILSHKAVSGVQERGHGRTQAPSSIIQSINLNFFKDGAPFS